MERFKVQWEDNALPVLKRTPKFSECVAQYFAAEIESVCAATLELSKNGQEFSTKSG